MGKPAYGRHRRIASLLRQHLSDWLRREEGTYQLLTISRVEVSEGLNVARIYISSWDRDVDRQKILDSLEESVPDVRRKLSRQLALRVVPRLRFMFDEELDDARRVQRLITEINEESALKKDDLNSDERNGTGSE